MHLTMSYYETSTDILYSSFSYNTQRNAITAVTEQRDMAIQERDSCIEHQDNAIADATKRARLDERAHFSKLLLRQKEKVASTVHKLSQMQTSTADAIRDKRNYELQANMSIQRARDSSDYAIGLEEEIAKLRSLVQCKDEELAQTNLELEQVIFRVHPPNINLIDRLS